MKIALDAMGGDNAPKSNILGVKKFLNSNPNVRVILVGDEPLLKEQLKINKNQDKRSCKTNDKKYMFFSLF